MTSRSPWGAAALLALLTAAIAGCGAKPDASAEKLAKIDALMHQIEQLETQADRVKDANDVKRLQRAYGYYFDKAAWDDIADLFADDGSMEIALNGVYEGKEHIRKYLYAMGGGKAGLTEGQLNEHMQLQPVVDVAPDGLTAKARFRAFIMRGELHKNASWGEGPYENEYVKQDGVWKIRKLHWYQTFVVPYEGGWAKNKDVTGGKTANSVPPDKPPTETYDVWPGVYVPAFHWNRPAVSGK